MSAASASGRPSIASPDGPSAEALARALYERRLAAPAALLLELLKPWRFVASQLLVMTEPILGHSQKRAARRHADWLQAPGGIESLLEALEQVCAHEPRRP